MRRPIAALGTALLILGLFAPTTLGAPTEPRTAPAPMDADLFSGQLNIKLVATGLSQPVGVVNAGDGTNRLFVLEKRGTVRVVANGVLQAGFFLDLRGSALGITTDGERGLLGLAFHPSFETNRKLFVYFTDQHGDIVIAEMTANGAGTSVSASTLDPILDPIEHSLRNNHNGGQLQFGPDGNLYIFTGDGGGAGDPDENGQNANVRLGKILRVTPDLNGHVTIPASNPYVGVAGDDAIWATGMRNPWRASFDRETGALWIADVGQGSWEEINREPADTGGRNYGWDCREGKHWYETAGCDTSAPWPYTDPIAEYGHGNGDCSVTGGYVYRGDVYTDLFGQYVLGDFCSGRLWTIGASSSTLTFQRDTAAMITSFGEAEGGALYMTDYNGRLYKVVAPPFTDVLASPFIDEITWLEGAGITGGCATRKFCPTANVLRGQMASFLVRALDLPPTGTDYFIDDETSIYEFDINALAAAGITGGCGENKFCPGYSVNRGQMASFLVRALDLPASATDYFTDDDGSIHEDDINALAAAGITGGCAADRFCPLRSVTREQMASFLFRALGT